MEGERERGKDLKTSIVVSRRRERSENPRLEGLQLSCFSLSPFSPVSLAPGRPPRRGRRPLAAAPSSLLPLFLLHPASSLPLLVKPPPALLFVFFKLLPLLLLLPPSPPPKSLFLPLVLLLLPPALPERPGQRRRAGKLGREPGCRVEEGAAAVGRRGLRWREELVAVVVVAEGPLLFLLLLLLPLPLHRGRRGARLSRSASPWLPLSSLLGEARRGRSSTRRPATAGVGGAAAPPPAPASARRRSRHRLRRRPGPCLGLGRGRELPRRGVGEEVGQRERGRRPSRRGWSASRRRSPSQALVLKRRRCGGRRLHRRSPPPRSPPGACASVYMGEDFCRRSRGALCRMHTGHCSSRDAELSHRFPRPPATK